MFSFSESSGADLVVELYVSAERGPCLLDRRVWPEMNLFVLDRSPDAFDENIVAPAALATPARKRHAGDPGFSVHTDGNLIFLWQSGGGLAGELHPSDEDLSPGAPNWLP